MEALYDRESIFDINRIVNAFLYHNSLKIELIIFASLSANYLNFALMARQIALSFNEAA